MNKSVNIVQKFQLQLIQYSVDCSKCFVKWGLPAYYRRNKPCREV